LCRFSLWSVPDSLSPRIEALSMIRLEECDLPDELVSAAPRAPEPEPRLWKAREKGGLRRWLADLTPFPSPSDGEGARGRGLACAPASPPFPLPIRWGGGQGEGSNSPARLKSAQNNNNFRYSNSPRQGASRVVPRSLRRCGPRAISFCFPR